MLKKVLIMVVSIILGFNFVNALNEPYYFIELNGGGGNYDAQYEFISYKYDTLEVYMSSSTHPGQSQLIGAYYLNGSLNVHNFNPLNLSLLFERNSGIVKITMNELTGDVCVDMREIHPKKYSLCTHNPFNINFLDYVISYQDEQDNERVTLIKGTKKDKGNFNIEEETFQIYAVFNGNGRSSSKVIYD